MNKNKSKIDELPLHQVETLERWLFEDRPALTYEQAADRLLQDFGVRISRSAVGAWWKRRAKERQFDRIIESAKEEQTAAEKLQNSKAFEALAGLVGQAAFAKKMAGEELSIETLKDLMDIATAGLSAQAETIKLKQKDQQIAQQDRKIALLEKKAAQADAAKGLLENKELSETERAARMREVFGL